MRLRTVAAGAAALALSLALSLALAAAQAAWAEPAQATNALSAGDRDPAAVILLQPRGTPAHRGSILLDAVARVLDRRTDLRPLSPEQSGLDLEAFAACPDRERLACWLREARRAGAAASGSGLLLILSTRPVGADAEEMSLILLDARAAAEAEAEARAGGSGAEEIENAIYEAAVKARELSASGAGDAAFARAFEDRLLAVLPALLGVDGDGRWDPYGAIELVLQGAEVGLVVSFDGRALGETTSALVSIAEVRPGRHTIALSRRGERAPAFASELAVERGKTVRVAASLVSPPIEPSTANRVVLYGGISAAALGTALVGLGLAASPEVQAIAVCPDGQCSSNTRSFSSFCELGAGDPNSCGRGGILVAPLGLALASLGASWVIGAIAEDERDLPLLSLAIGIAAGVAVYGAAAAADR